MNNVYDLIIVGAGPVGLFASFYAGMRGLNTVLIETRNEVGGALTAIYPEKYIYDMVGFPKILAKDLINNLYVQSSHFNNEIKFNSQIVDIVKNEEDIFELSSKNGEVIYSKTVLITTGMGSFTPRKLPALKGLEHFEKQEYSGIKYVIKDKEKYYGQKVVIAGGGNSALDWAHDFNGNSKSVSLVHRLPDWQAHEESIEKLQGSGINVYQPWQFVGANEGDKLEYVVIEHMETKEQKTIEADLLIVNIGFLPSKTKFENLPIKVKGGAVMVEPSSLESQEVPGVFAAGDSATFEGKLKLICVGSAEAAIAVNHAAKKIDNTVSLKPQFSSNFFSDDFNKKKK
ncbi:MAG: NAD(P)/FAD-dependent oxidoreductase [Chlorobi bacterium]|nr:NAD(P)/FAD-dependent oxidoreductase [Chlorobiota bacterium]